MLESQRDIIERWGGETEVRYAEEWRREIKEFDGLKIHLTMYGEKINENIEDLKQQFSDTEDLLIVVGAEKVPRWVYKNVDQNISVGNQPHSEIAALAVFMDRIQEGEIKEDFERAEIYVEPSENRKLTEKIGSE